MPRGVQSHGTHREHAHPAHVHAHVTADPVLLRVQRAVRVHHHVPLDRVRAERHRRRRVLRRERDRQAHPGPLRLAPALPRPVRHGAQGFRGEPAFARVRGGEGAERAARRAAARRGEKEKATRKKKRARRSAARRRRSRRTLGIGLRVRRRRFFPRRGFFVDAAGGAGRKRGRERVRRKNSARRPGSRGEDRSRGEGFERVLVARWRARAARAHSRARVRGRPLGVCHDAVPRERHGSASRFPAGPVRGRLEPVRADAQDLLVRRRHREPRAVLAGLLRDGARRGGRRHRVHARLPHLHLVLPLLRGQEVPRPPARCPAQRQRRVLRVPTHERVSGSEEVETFEKRKYSRESSRQTRVFAFRRSAQPRPRGASAFVQRAVRVRAPVRARAQARVRGGVQSSRHGDIAASRRRVRRAVAVDAARRARARRVRRRGPREPSQRGGVAHAVHRGAAQAAGERVRARRVRHLP